MNLGSRDSVTPYENGHHGIKEKYPSNNTVIVCMYALLVLDFAEKSHHNRSKSEHNAEYFLMERNHSIVIE
jgi:hypothetical protein